MQGGAKVLQNAYFTVQKCPVEPKKALGQKSALLGKKKVPLLCKKESQLPVEPSVASGFYRLSLGLNPWMEKGGGGENISHRFRFPRAASAL